MSLLSARKTSLFVGPQGPAGPAGAPGPIGPSGINGGPLPVVSNVTVLRATPGSVSQPRMVVQAHTTFGDGGGGEFNWVAGDNTADDNGTIFAATGGRWHRAEATGFNCSAHWFGGMPNTVFLYTDGKYYTDTGHGTESRDNAAQLKTALAYAVAKGIAAVYVAPGVWYMKTKQGNPISGSFGNEFVLWKSGVGMIGGQYGVSRLFVAGGTNVNTGSGGYSCIIGDWSGGTLNNVFFDGIVFDHNSAHNQWWDHTANIINTQSIAVVRNAAILIENGDHIVVTDVESTNANGINAFYFGDFSSTSTLAHLNINQMLVTNCSNDPLLDDSSMVSIGAQHVQGVNMMCWSARSNNTTAFEIHGSDVNIVAPMATGFNGFYNCGADSDNSDGYHVSGARCMTCTVGLTIFSYSGHTVKNFTWEDSHMNVASFSAIKLNGGNGSSVPYGGGYTNLHFKNLSLTSYLQTSGEHSALDLQEVIDGLTIENVDMSDFNDGSGGGSGIKIGTRAATGTAGVKNVVLKNVNARNCGAYAVELLGVAGDVAAHMTNVTLDGIEAIGSTTNVLHITAFTDGTVRSMGNRGTVVVDRTNYPNLTFGGTPYVYDVGNLGTSTSSAGISIINRTPATSTATTMNAGFFAVTANYWTGSASGESDTIFGQNAGAAPQALIRTNANGVGWQTVFSASYDNSAYTTWSCVGSGVKLSLQVGANWIWQDNSSAVWMQLNYGSTGSLILTVPTIIFSAATANPSITQLAAPNNTLATDMTITSQPAATTTSTNAQKIAGNLTIGVGACSGGDHGGVLALTDDAGTVCLQVTSGGSTQKHQSHFVSGAYTCDSRSDDDGNVILDEVIQINASGVTVKLPASPGAARVGTRIRCYDYAGTHNHTLDGNGLTINGNSTISVTSTAGGFVEVELADTTHWVIGPQH